MSEGVRVLAPPAWLFVSRARPEVRLGSLSLPVEVVTQAVGVLAKRRAGKSYFARHLVEGLHAAGCQVVVVDPKGDWWGVRASADGAGPGPPITILGGERGDLPLEPSAGAVVARLVVEERVSVLLDLSLLRKHEVATFMAVFLEDLYRLKAREANRTPVMLVVDEADAVAPQRPQKGEERMLGAAEDIVRRGGQRGLGCTLITQRAAVLNKNVLTQVGVLVALQTIAPQDLKALGEWVDVHGTPEGRRELMGSLPSLPQGSAWVWAPGWPGPEGIFERVRVGAIRTYDSGSTPRAGDVRVEPRVLASVDLAVLERRMAETVARAAENDPRRLRARVRALEEDLVRAQRGVSPAAAGLEEALVRERLAVARREGRAEAEASLAGVAARDARVVGVFRSLAEGLERIAGDLAGLNVAMREALSEAAMDSPALAVRLGDEVPGAAAVRREARRRPRPGTGAVSSPVDAAMRRVLDALVWLEVAGAPAPFPHAQVAALAGLRAGVGYWRSVLGRCKAAGLVEYPAAGRLALTAEGRLSASPLEVPVSPEALLARVLERCDGPMARVLEPLVEAGRPVPWKHEPLAARAGLQAGVGYWRSILGRLRALDLVRYPARGQVAASPWLFLKEGA